MDVSKFLESSMNKFFASLILPSMWAVYPIYILIIKLFPENTSNLSVFEQVLFAGLILAIGLLIDDFGVKKELKFDADLKIKDEEFDRKWKYYLHNKMDEDLPLSDYLKHVVVRMKFEINFYVSCQFNLVTSFALAALYPGNFSLHIILYALYASVIVLLMTFLHNEAFKSCQLLGETRTDIFLGLGNASSQATIRVPPNETDVLSSSQPANAAQLPPPGPNSA